MTGAARPPDAPGLRRGLGSGGVDPRPWTLLALTALVLAPGLAGQLVWDDALLVLRNDATASLADWPRWFTADLWAGTPLAADSPGYYRPLVLADLALDRALAGPSPALHRAHSLAWHLLAGGLLWRLLRRVGLAPGSAAAGLALFLLHPAQLEATQFISARNDPMAAAWLLGALLLLTRPAPGVGALLGGALCTLAAALCKETALLAPALLGALGPALPGSTKREQKLTFFGIPWTAHLALASGLALALALRWAAGVPWPSPPAPAPGQVLHAAAHWAEVLVWPLALAPGASLTWPAPTPWWALALALAAGGVALARGGRPARAGLLLAALGLAPAFAGLLHAGVLADRYLYLPMVGLALALGATLRHRALAPALALALGLATAAQVPVWQDDLSLWGAGARVRATPYAFGALAKVLEAEGRLDEAAAWNRRALDADPPLAHACYNAASLHLARGRPADAVESARFALARGCEASPELLAPLSLALALTGRWDEAEALAVGLPRDPTGLAVVVAVTAAARRGDEGPFAQAAERGDPEALKVRVRWLLAEVGEELPE